jgi:hypothetical protein
MELQCTFTLNSDHVIYLNYMYTQSDHVTPSGSCSCSVRNTVYADFDHVTIPNTYHALFIYPPGPVSTKPYHVFIPELHARYKPDHVTVP